MRKFGIISLVMTFLLSIIALPTCFLWADGWLTVVYWAMIVPVFFLINLIVSIIYICSTHAGHSAQVSAKIFTVALWVALFLLPLCMPSVTDSEQPVRQSLPFVLRALSDIEFARRLSTPVFHGSIWCGGLISLSVCICALWVLFDSIKRTPRVITRDE